MNSDVDEYLHASTKASVALSREEGIDDWIDWDGGNRAKGVHGKWYGRINKRRADETVDGYERRVGHEATMIMYPKEREQLGGIRLSQRPDRISDQPDLWKVMMNFWLLQFLRERRDVEPEKLQTALHERDRLAAQCREMWGPKIPADRTPILEVLSGMMKQLEAQL